MTCQPAAKVGLFFSMAINTESHFKTVTPEPVHGLHRAVTLLTGNLFPYVALMIEQYMFREVVDFLPWSRCLGVEIPVLFFYPRMVGNDVLMAEETLPIQVK